MGDYRKQSYLLMTTDPVHIGAGGYRLGRVDLSIVREPGTNVPKIPGTSLHGVARSYAAMQYGLPNCAGQKDHCGQRDCPICYTFGSLQGTDDKQKAFSGRVSLFDATLVLFPVHSMAGPVWVSTMERLREAGFKVTDGAEPSGDRIVLTWSRRDPLNLGWLVLDVAADKIKVEAPQKWQGERWDAIKDRIAIVREALFGQVVNSNLEVRTSVSIDPRTGAAESGALFTYEAIPRAAFLAMDVVLDDYAADGKPNWPIKEDTHGQELPKPWADPLDVVRAGLELAAWLGVGGMGTRGFGRLRIVGEPIPVNWSGGKDEQ